MAIIVFQCCMCQIIAQQLIGQCMYSVLLNNTAAMRAIGSVDRQIGQCMYSVLLNNTAAMSAIGSVDRQIS